MSNKLKYYIKKIADPVEFENNIVRIELPNGDEYTLQYDTREKGLIINKAHSDGNSAMTVKPHVSNQILIK